MGQQTYPFDRIIRKVAASGSNDLTLDPVQTGRLYCLQRVSVENETSPCTSIQLLKSGRGGEFLVDEEKSAQPDVLYSHGRDIYLTEGQYLLVRFAGCTASDSLVVYVSGYYRVVREVY